LSSFFAVNFVVVIVIYCISEYFLSASIIDSMLKCVISVEITAPYLENNY
jgi:hypothetical protein